MAEQLTDETVDWILNDLEEKGGTPAEVARQARRLREYIAALRDPSTEQLVRDLAETPMTDETPGVAYDGQLDKIIAECRTWVRLSA